MAYNLKIKKLLSTAVVGFASAVSVACSPVKTLNALVPSDSYELHANIAYGSLPRQGLDIYLPKQSKAEPLQAKLPVVLFFYGGSWDSGDKADYKFVAEAFTSNGFIAVVPDYRIYPEVLFPGFMADPAKAARWVKDHIQALGGDPDRIFLAGHSAGAHIAVMLALNEEYLAKEQLKLSDFRGSIGLAGPYDFLPLTSERLKVIFGTEDQRWKSQPINFVTGHNQPMLLLVGLKDGTVGTHNTYHLAAKIKAKGGSVQVVEFPNYGHIDMAAKLAKPLRGDGDLLKPIVEFIHQHS